MDSPEVHRVVGAAESGPRWDMSAPSRRSHVGVRADRTWMSSGPAGGLIGAQGGAHASGGTPRASPSGSCDSRAASAPHFVSPRTGPPNAAICICLGGRVTLTREQSQGPAPAATCSHPRESWAHPGASWTAAGVLVIAPLPEKPPVAKPCHTETDLGHYAAAKPVSWATPTR